LQYASNLLFKFLTVFWNDNYYFLILILSILFNIQLNNRKLVNTILYVDDQILMAAPEDDLQTMAHHLNFIAIKYKMTISSTKTKSMEMWGGGTTYRG